MGQRKDEPSKWCNEKDPTNKRVLSFIRDYLSDAQEVAKELGIEVEWLLGLAAAESGYGTSNIARSSRNMLINVELPARILKSMDIVIV